MITSVLLGEKNSYFFNLKKMISNFDTYKGLFFQKLKKELPNFYNMFQNIAKI
jgi:hypothetical protein